MKALRYPTISITLFFAAGIAAGYFLQPLLAYSIAFTAIAFILLSISFWTSKKDLLQKPWFAGSAWLLALCLGVLAQAIHYSPNQKNHYTHFLSPGTTPVISGTIQERLKPNDYSEKYYFGVTAINRKTATGKLLLSVPKDSLNQKLQPGDRLIIAGSPAPITHPMNPGQFNYAAYMAKQGVYGQLMLRKNYIITGSEHNLDYYIGRLRAALINSFAIHNYPQQTLQLINALLFGQRQDLAPETNTAYTNAGVVHILAISGLHFSLLFLGFNWLLAPLKRINCFGRAGHFIAVLLLLWSFALITGLSASVVRAAVMISFVMTGQYFNRKATIYNSLAVSALVLLIAKPVFLFDAGFQLSYAAVLAIVSLQPLYKNIKISKYRAVNYITSLVLITVVAQIGVLPLSLYYFNQFPLLFPIANIVAIPLSSIILVLGILVVLLNFTFPAVAVLSGKLLELLIDGMNTFIKWIASFDSLVIRDIPFTLVLNIALYAAIVFGGLWIFKKSYRRTAALLASVLVFQLTCMATAAYYKNTSALVVFNNRKTSIIAVKQRDTIKAYSSDSLAIQDKSLLAYNRKHFSQQLQSLPLKIVLWFNTKKILVIDSACIYNLQLRPDVLLLVQSPKINLDRVIQQLHPTQVVADGTNYKTYIARWAATCQKHKIPFHATAEKGFYELN
jgi:competence protein ComEC